MLKTLRKAFQIKDIRDRLFYTFAMLIVVRLGSQLPTPGVDPTFIHKLGIMRGNNLELTVSKAFEAHNAVRIPADIDTFSCWADW